MVNLQRFKTSCQIVFPMKSLSSKPFLCHFPTLMYWNAEFEKDIWVPVNSLLLVYWDFNN